MLTWLEAAVQLLQEPDSLERWDELVASAERAHGGVCKALSSQDVETLRESYTRLVHKFPFCHQYWLRLATWEFRLGYTARAEEVYLEALRFSPYLLDVWCAYLGFKDTVCWDHDAVAALFEEARVRVGRHFYAHVFYDLYLDFLERHLRVAEYGAVLRRAVEIPMYGYARFFKLLVATLDRGEPHIRSLVLPQEHVRYDWSNLLLVGAKLKKTFTDVYIVTQCTVFERWRYEEQLAPRLYFDTKPVSRNTRAVWRLYLDYTENHPGSVLDARLTHERCVQACALYEQLWLDYARWCLRQGQPEQARGVLRRGVEHVAVSCTAIRLEWCRVEAGLGNLLKARDILDAAIEMLPLQTEYHRLRLALEHSLHPENPMAVVELLVATVPATELAHPLDCLWRELAAYPVDWSKVEQTLTPYKAARTGSAFWEAYVECVRRHQPTEAPTAATHALRATNTLPLSVTPETLVAYCKLATEYHT